MNLKIDFSSGNDGKPISESAKSKLRILAYAAIAVVVAGVVLHSLSKDDAAMDKTAATQENSFGNH